MGMVSIDEGLRWTYDGEELPAPDDELPVCAVGREPAFEDCG